MIITLWIYNKTLNLIVNIFLKSKKAIIDSQVILTYQCLCGRGIKQILEERSGKQDYTGFYQELACLCLPFTHLQENEVAFTVLYRVQRFLVLPWATPLAPS